MSNSVPEFREWLREGLDLATQAADLEAELDAGAFYVGWESALLDLEAVLDVGPVPYPQGVLAWLNKELRLATQAASLEVAFDDGDFYTGRAGALREVWGRLSGVLDTDPQED